MGLLESGVTMEFDQLSEKMRVFEKAKDQPVEPGTLVVVRLDGRELARQTHEELGYEMPYDERFRGLMVETARRLMEGTPRLPFGYLQADEISLFLGKAEAGAPSLAERTPHLLQEGRTVFQEVLKDCGEFQCRFSLFPKAEQAIEYFLWRRQAATRAALDGSCFWALRAEGWSARRATKEIQVLDESARKQLLRERGSTPFETLPAWQTHGIGMLWEPVSEDGNESRLTMDLELRSGEAYRKLLGELIR